MDDVSCENICTMIVSRKLVLSHQNSASSQSYSVTLSR